VQHLCRNEPLTATRPSPPAVDARLAALSAKTQACVADIRAELASQLALLSTQVRARCNRSWTHALSAFWCLTRRLLSRTHPQLRSMPLVAFRDTHGGALSSEVFDAVNAACVARGAPHAERNRAPRPSAASMPPPPPGMLRGAAGPVGGHAAFGPLAPPASAVAPTPGAAMAGPTVVRSGRTLRRTPPGADESAATQPAGAGAAEPAVPFVAAATVLAGSRKRARVPGQAAVPPVPVWSAPAVPMATPGPTTGTRSQGRVPGTALVGATPMATRAPQQGEVFFSANGA
jgi:hypothetical protein